MKTRTPVAIESIDPGNYIKVSKDAALVDLFDALDALETFPAPPDHLILLSQMVKPEKFSQAVSETIKEKYYARRINSRYDLGTGVIMNCKGSRCPYAGECEIKMAGIPDDVLEDLPCIIEVAIAKQVFTSCIAELIKSPDYVSGTGEAEISLSGVDIISIMDVIRAEILTARLHKRIKIHGDMYEEETNYPDGTFNRVLAINPAYDYLTRLGKSKNESLKQLVIDRESKVKYSSIAEARANFYQKLKEKVRLVELDITPPELGGAIAEEQVI